VKILDLPGASRESEPAAELGALAEILFESAALLAEARDGGDPGFQESATELAIRSLRTAGRVIGHQPARPTSPTAPGRLINGPWLAE
jgi:hypothetical protein